MAKLKIEIKPETMTYFKGLARAVGMDLASIAYRSLVYEMSVIEKALLKHQQTLLEKEEKEDNESGSENTEGVMENGSATSSGDPLANAKDVSAKEEGT